MKKEAIKKTELEAKEEKLKNFTEAYKKLCEEHGFTFVARINHYMHLLMERDFNKNSEQVLNVNLTVVEIEK